MANNCFLYEYDKIPKDDRWSCSIFENFSENDNTNKTKISEYLEIGLHYYLIADALLNENEMSIEDIIKERRNYSNVLFCLNSNLNLGYFCSSPVVDLIVGKTKRGTIRKKTKKTKNITKYYFDGNKLSFVDYLGTDVLIFYNETQREIYEISLFFNELYAMTVCRYNCENQIIERLAISFKKTSVDEINRNFLGIYSGTSPVVIRNKHNNLDCLFSINEEKYIYESDRIVEMQKTEFRSYLSRLSINKYVFRYKKDKFKDYDFINCYSGNKSTYKVYRHRKYNEFLSPPLFSDYV